MILITGAGGKTGRAIVSRLTDKGIKLRAWVRRPEACPAGCEPFIGDMENPKDWDRACMGIEKLYLICPNMHPHEVAIGRMALVAAKAADVKHLVYHSVLHPQTQEMAHHWNKLQVEEMIFASGVPFTILQPTAYMQNLLPQWSRVTQDGILHLPYPAEAPISLIDLHDVADAAALVLASNTFIGSTLELVGTHPLTQAEVCKVLAAELGRSVTFAEIDLKEWEAENITLPTYPRETLLAMFRYYAKYGLIGNPAVLRLVLGREPLTLAQFIANTVNGR